MMNPGRFEAQSLMAVYFRDELIEQQTKMAEFLSGVFNVVNIRRRYIKEVSHL